MRKGICLLLLCMLLGLLFCLSFAGCGEDASADPSAVPSGPSHAASAPGSVSEPSAVGKPAVSGEESAAVTESTPIDESTSAVESTPPDESPPPEESTLPEESNSEAASSSAVTSEPEEGSEPDADPPPLSDGSVRVYAGLRFRLPVGWGIDPAAAPEALFFASPAEGSSSVSAAYTPLETVQGLTEALLIEEFRGSLSSAWESAGAKDVKAAAVSVSLLGEPRKALSLTASVNGRSVCQLQLYLLRSDGLYTLTVTAETQANAKALLSAFEADA